MQAGTALIGRRLLAAFVAVMLMASMMLLFADTSAQASHIPPDDIVAQVNGPDGTNSPGFWEDYLADLGVDDATCVHINEDGGDPYELGAPPAGQVWVMLVVKQGTNNYVFLDPAPNHEYPTTGTQAPGFSHAMECYAPEPEDTTTTTVEDTTTTTVEDTTTTTSTPPSGWACVEGEVVFIEDATGFEGTLYETQLEAFDDPDCIEVEGSVIVTVTGECLLDGDDGFGRITVNISSEGGATVVIRDANGAEVATVTETGTVDVAEDATYTWEATPGEDFVFPPGAEATGSVEIEECSEEPETTTTTVEDEVLDTEVLPFTGGENDMLALLAGGLGLLGTLVLASTRRMEEN